MKRLLTLFLALSVAAAFQGCKSSTNSITDTNKAEAQNIAAADPTGDPDLAGFNDDSEAIEASPQGFGAYAPQVVIPDSINLCWYRHLRHTSRTVVASGDTANMLVNFTRHNEGTLVGRLCDDGGHGHGHESHALTVAAEAESALYRKGYKVTWSRTTQYKKVANPNEDDGEDGSRWILLGTTIAHTVQDSPVVASQPVIVSVTISGHDSAGAPLSYTFDDVNELIDPTTLPRFAPGELVTVTVVTNAAAAQMAFLHFDEASGDPHKLRRRPLTYNGSNGFTGEFMIKRGHGLGNGSWRGRRARQGLWVDVLNKDSVRDTTAPYAAAGWGLPYRLRLPHGAVALMMHE